MESEQFWTIKKPIINLTQFGQKKQLAMDSTGSLRRNLKTHSGEKSNKCNQCDYASSQAGHLETHLEMHSGEKKHLKMQSGEKPNKCNQCDFGFVC